MTSRKRAGTEPHHERSDHRFVTVDDHRIGPSWPGRMAVEVAAWLNDGALDELLARPLDPPGTENARSRRPPLRVSHYQPPGRQPDSYGAEQAAAIVDQLKGRSDDT